MPANGDGRARSPRGGSTGVEALLRELLAASAETRARLEDLTNRLETTQDDARQARDLGNRISTILEEQNIIARFDAHKADLRQQVTEIRQDFVVANTKLRNDLDAVDKAAAADRAKLAERLKALEDDLQRREGIKSFAGWLMKNAPWLFAGIAAFGAGLGLKDKLP